MVEEKEEGVSLLESALDKSEVVEDEGERVDFEGCSYPLPEFRIWMFRAIRSSLNGLPPFRSGSGLLHSSTVVRTAVVISSRLV